MRKVTLRGLAARKLRTILTASAVVLGVAMISGTYVLTDTINRSFNGIFKQATAGVDVSVTPREVISQDKVSAGDFPEALLAKARAVDGVGEGGRRDLHRRHDLQEERQALGPGRRAEHHHHAAPRALRPLHLHPGPPAADGGRGGAGPLHRPEGRLPHSAIWCASPASEPAKRYRLVGLAKFGSSSRWAARAWRSSTCARPSAPPASRASSRSSTSRPTPGVTPQQLRTRVRGRPAADRHGAHRQGGGPGPVRRHQAGLLASSPPSCSCSPGSRSSWAPS